MAAIKPVSSINKPYFDSLNYAYVLFYMNKNDIIKLILIFRDKGPWSFWGDSKMQSELRTTDSEGFSNTNLLILIKLNPC